MNIMSPGQYSILAILGENPRREYHMHELGRIIGKKPGVFQRGINSLEKEGLIIRIALIYGSYARNKMRTDSDVDLLIVADDAKAEDTLVEALDGIEKALQREVNYRIYDREDFGRKRRSGDLFLQEVLSGEHIALKGSL
jgi:predicted nucleotidyltransferase